MTQSEKESGSADAPSAQTGASGGSVDAFRPEKHPCPPCNDNSDVTRGNHYHKKQRCTAHDQRASKKRRVEMTPEELKATLKRQIEYYLSEENLCTDAFFHEKIEEAVKGGKGVALNIEFVMSSPRIKFLEATKQEVLDAVKDTSEFTIRCEGEDTWFVRKNPLPVLRKRKENKKADRRKDINGGRGRDPHAIGCLLKISGVPENYTKWQEIKDALREKLPEKVHIRYVSRVDAKRQCVVWLGSFEGDREFFKDPVTLTIEGSDCSVSLLSDSEARGCLTDLPPRIRTSREKELMQFRRQLAGLALTLGGIKFNSVDHLHKCLNDFLDKTEVGNALKPGSAGEKTLIALLDYHPNAFFKKGGNDKELIGVKVDYHNKATSKSGEKAKCFFAIRKHKESGEEDSEDFSVTKCITELSRDPPVDLEALKVFMQKRYDSSRAAYDAAQEQMQKRKAAASAAAAATSATGVATDVATDTTDSNVTKDTGAVQADTEVNAG